ncbi:protein delta homolog 1 isoform X3 [Sceloporus undulatus]|uniref:protein delta homolog 1 isoform X3 n=1 Tax=Sceloporus undulatus TaxID=8520 RepID=UPI001C4B864F|nr:protein delta homolog 1 isoform X3 [Sceloporus undulatus]
MHADQTVIAPSGVEETQLLSSDYLLDLDPVFLPVSKPKEFTIWFKTDVHPCASKPCTNNSTTCIETGNGGYICLCAEGYTGKSCHVKKGPCIVNGSPCQNGGTCVDDDGFASHASCLCLPGFTGNFCEIDIDDCEPNPCENGGTCTDIGRGFHCHCPTGYGGALCNSHTLVCASNPCENGGTCHAHPKGGFECLCKPRFVGITCASADRNKSLNGEAKHRGNHHPHPRVHQKPVHTQEREILTIKETIENRQPLLNKSQVICFMVLGLLTCLVVLGTTGIIFFSKFEKWLANARYSQLVRKERDGFLKAKKGENLSVKIIFPDQTDE